jgi:hypothetical protein
MKFKFRDDKTLFLEIQTPELRRYKQTKKELEKKMYEGFAV